MGRSKKDAPKDAAKAQAAAAREGLEELRRQFDIGRQDLIDARGIARADLSQAGQRAIDFLAPTAIHGAAAAGRLAQSATPGGFGQRLGDILGGGALDPLIQERTQAARDQLGAVGLSRSGTALEEVAKIPTGLGLQIEQLLTGRDQQLAAQGLAATSGAADAALAAGGGQANISQGVGSALAGLGQQFGAQTLATQQGIGQAQASGILGSAQARAQGFGNILGGLGQAAGLFFSDPRLKKNIVKIGEVRDLGIYQWDWIDEVQDLEVAKTSTLGFMADEVAEKRPSYCVEVAGFKCIAYTPLIEQLDYELGQQALEAA